jgi:hypothetical protein
MNKEAYSLTVYNGRLIVGGMFTEAGGVSANSIALWDGSNWEALGSGVGGIIGFPRVYALTLYNGQLIAGGYFTTAGGASANQIARWDGSNWEALGSGINDRVFALTVYNNELIAGGVFAAGTERWNGSSWQALGGGMGGSYNSVRALTVYNGELIAGGVFTTAGGVDASKIARWNGSIWQPLGSGVLVSGSFAGVSALTVYNGELIAGGRFHTAGGVDVNSIARWNGSNWQPLGGGINQEVLSLTVYNGELIAGGSYVEAGGVSAKCIARWDGSSWKAMGSGMNSIVKALTVYEGELIAGGSFTSAGGRSSYYWAKWGVPEVHIGDLNHDCVVDWPDLDRFSEWWLDQDCMYNSFCYEADLNYDFTVNFKDFAALAGNWLIGQ